MRMVRVALVAAVFSAGVMVAAPNQPIAGAGADAHADADADGNEITDPRLLGEIARIAARRMQGAADASIAVEVLTTNDTAVADAIEELGGTVTGTVTGAVVQATVPVATLKTLANAPGAQSVRYPRRAGYVPGTARRTRLRGR